MKPTVNQQKTNQRYFVLLALIFSLICMYACNKDDDPITQNTLKINAELVLPGGEMNEMLAVFPDLPEGEYDYHELFDDLKELSGNVQEKSVKIAKVSYTSTDNEGHQTELSGLLIYPPDYLDKNSPLISLNHGTELEKSMAPSQFTFDKDALKYPEVAIGILTSSCMNWIMIMPDYQGMGEDVTELHPYCIKDRLATATVDMLEAARNTILQDIVPGWQGNAYMFGYSEGGYVTMAATQEAEKRKLPLRGAACMDGPYDLSGTMLDLMLKDTVFPVPYFLPMLLVGYHTVYPDVFVYEDMLRAPYSTDIPTYTTGFYSTAVVDSIMPPSGILKDVFTAQFIDLLNDPSSSAWLSLNSNNSFTGWSPATNMLLWHCKNDDCVPFGNFLKAKDAFGSLPNITYTEIPPIAKTMSTVHASAALFAFIAGPRWIHNQEKKE